jgi:hypothetical protein
VFTLQKSSPKLGLGQACCVNMAMHGHLIFMVSHIYNPAAVHYTTEEYQNLTGNKTCNIDILKSKHLKSIYCCKVSLTYLTTTIALFTVTEIYYETLPSSLR